MSPKAFTEHSFRRYINEGYSSQDAEAIEREARGWIEFVHNLRSIPMAHLSKIPVAERCD